jgi:hypothetical protein
MANNRSTREQLGVDLPEPQQVVQEEQPVSDGVVEERPEWLPEKFKTVEDYNSSYTALEDELRRRGEDQRRMESQLSQMQELLEEDRAARQQAPPQQMGSQQELRDQLMASYENDPIGTMAYLAQQYAMQTVDTRLQALQQQSQPQAVQQLEQQNQLLAITVDRALGDRYDDWGEYKERVAREIEQDPTLLPPESLTSPDVTMRQLSRIYENVKARDVLEQAQNGNFVNHELSQMKRQAQTISGQGARPGEPSADDEHFARLKQAAQGLSYAAWRDAGN